MKARFTGSMVFVLLLGLGIVANADVVGFWTFDDVNVGNSFGQDVGFDDYSGNNLTGVLGLPVSPPGSAPGPSGAEGDFALSLDGQAALIVDDSDAELLNVLEPPITLEAWVRSDEMQTGHVGIISYGVPGGRDGAGGWKLGIVDGDLLFTTFGVVDVRSSVQFIYDGEWHHIAAIYSDVDEWVLFYLDGEELDLVEENRPMRDPSSKELNIGAQYTSIGRFNGDIDRVRISNAVLENELDTDPANPRPVGPNTLAYFDFDEGIVPYSSQGADPIRTAISLESWLAGGNIPRTNVFLPTIEEISPSGQAGDLSLFFDIDMNSRAFVVDEEGLLDFSDGDWTLEAWVSTDIPTDDRMVIFYYGRPGEGYSLSVNSDQRVWVTTLGIADLASTDAIVPFNFDWTHVAVSHVAGESINYFINGELVETIEYTGLTNSAGGGNLYIGAEWNGGLPFFGSIDRIRISNSALAAEDLDSNPGVVHVVEWSLYE